MTKINETVNTNMEQTQVNQDVQSELLRAAEAISILQEQLDTKEEELRKLRLAAETCKQHNENLHDTISLMRRNAMFLYLTNIGNVLEIEELGIIEPEQAITLIEDLVNAWNDQ